MTSNSFFKYIVIVKTCSDIFYSFPLPSAFLSTDIERGKVFGLNTLRRRKIPTETACRPDLSTFKG